MAKKKTKNKKNNDRRKINKSNKKRGAAPMDTSSDGFVTLPDAPAPQPMDTAEGQTANLGASSINRKINKQTLVRRTKNLKRKKSFERLVLTMEKQEEKVVKMKTKKQRIQSAKTLYD